MEDKKIEEYLAECFKIIDENVEVLSDIEFEIEQQKDNEIIPNLQLHDLIDMTQDVAESIKIRKAEASYMRRQLD
ncbi:MAG: hypothetical protein HYS75_02210 [Nitrosopumilales archaeon]|nr:hypothetical protein [Nitrosopumilales archaeon]